MVIALAVLAYMVWITMNGNELFTNKNKNESMSNSLSTAPAKNNESAMTPPPREGMYNHLPMYPAQNNNNAIMLNRENNMKTDKDILKQQFEEFADGVNDDYNNARFLNKETIVSPTMPSPEIPQPKLTSDYPPMSTNSPANLTNINEIDYATVPDTFKGSQPSGETNDDVNDVYKIDGTDLLAAPLADRFYYTNSIANVNRNATHDLRGDISIAYNDSYTPFYQSSIYGEPLTINRLGDSK